MPSEGKEILCYNRGCGKVFDPECNNEDSCRHHPGVPVFHDAYKGWSCCNKKCTDFTEFLNIKGCTTSKHSNVKPIEPEKPVVDKLKADEVIEYKAPKLNAVSSMPRPPFDSSLTKLKCEVTNSLKLQFDSISTQKRASTADSVSCEVSIGTSCCNGGCKTQYTGPETNSTNCVYHPGVPIFHEGLKFWSCCKKRTTDFNTFLDQVGCKIGQHSWHRDQGANDVIQCRHDWHQTSTHVIVSVYAKKYDPYLSSVEINPIRLKINLLFPEDGKKFELDIELRGIVSVDLSECTMSPAKVEVRLKKAECMSWSKLDFPRAVMDEAGAAGTSTDKKQDCDVLTPQFDAVDLSDL